jgi:hypothetical protein
VRGPLLEEIETAVASRRFAAIMDDGPWLPVIDRHYSPARRLFDDDGTFRPVTGFPARPERLLLPRLEAHPRPVKPPRRP